MGKAIVITGTPGTGKTTISKLLSDKLNIPTFNLTELALSNNLILGEDPERDTLIADTNKLSLIITNKIKELKGKAIVEGHYSDITPAILLDCCIVFRTKPDILEMRLKKRNYRKSKILENIQAEILGVCLSDALGKYPHELIFEVDTSKDPIKKTLDNVIKIIKFKPVEFKYGKITWLSELSEIELRKYFKN
ncbi:MAG: adenylate kinase family protein [Candidatus Odinarchaeia archaeon]